MERPWEKDETQFSVDQEDILVLVSTSSQDSVVLKKKF